MIKLYTKRLSLVLAATLMVAMTPPGVMAFCFSNDSLSGGGFEVKQMSPRLLSARKEMKECKNDLTGECLGKSLWSGTKAGLQDLGRDFIGRGGFSKMVAPDKTECCSWKDKGCNRAGKKNSKIIFMVTKKKFKTVKKEALKQFGIKGVKYNARVGEVEWTALLEIGATDHVECRFDGREYGCRNYVWPQTPPRPNEKTSRGLLIKSMNGDKCLEVGGWNKKNGANVNMWKCHGGKNQRWVIYRNGTIRSEMNWKCLDIAVRNVKSIKNGSNVGLHDCHGNANQRWTHWTRSNELVNRVPGGSKMCLDVAKRSTKNGANVNIWKCGKKQANQRWTVGPTATYPQVLKVRYPGKCVDNTGGKKKGTKVHAWDCNAKNANQQWSFRLLANNYVQIKSRRSGLCLDVAGSSKNNGARVGQWTCHKGANQQWKVHSVKDGWFQLRARHSGKCLDLKGPYKKNGTPFQQWACKNVPQQSFQHAG